MFYSAKARKVLFLQTSCKKLNLYPSPLRCYSNKTVELRKRLAPDHCSFSKRVPLASWIPGCAEWHTSIDANYISSSAFCSNMTSVISRFQHTIPERSSNYVLIYKTRLSNSLFRTSVRLSSQKYIFWLCLVWISHSQTLFQFLQQCGHRYCNEYRDVQTRHVRVKISSYYVNKRSMDFKQSFVLKRPVCKPLQHLLTICSSKAAEANLILWIHNRFFLRRSEAPGLLYWRCSN